MWTIDVVSSDTTEGTVTAPTSGQLTFQASDWNAEQTVTITGVFDNLSDGDQSYSILLTDNTSADERYLRVDPPDVTLKNLDLTDKGQFYVSAVSNDTDESGDITATFTVRLASQPTGDVTIDVVSSDTTEGTVTAPTSGQLTFQASDWNAEQTVTITGVFDNLSDGDQSYSILLTDNTSADERYLRVDPPDVTLKNLDLTDKGQFYVSAVSNDTDESGDITATFTVRLASQPTGDVTIDVVSSDTTEGTVTAPTSGQLTFQASDWNAEQTVTITGVFDNLSDGDQSYSILLTDNTSADERYLRVDPPDVTLKNLDLTDKGQFYVSAVSNDTDESGDITATFTVRLASQPTGDVTIDVVSSDTTEGTVTAPTSGQLTFQASDWNAEQTVTITGVFDNLSDGDQSYSILLTDNTSADERYLRVDPPDVTLKNLDLTDKGQFYVSAVSNDTDESGDITATFTVRLASQPTGDVTIDVVSSDTTEGTVTAPNSGQLTFQASDWNAEQTVTITGVFDNLSDGDQSYSILLTDNTSADERYLRGCGSPGCDPEESGSDGQGSVLCFCGF